MSGYKPFSPAEYEEFNKERKRLNKTFAARHHTLTVLYKSLCASCDYNASNGLKITYDCPRCRCGRWHSCSPRQVYNGEILKKLQTLYGNIEWVKAYNPDRSLAYSWRRHESNYEQDWGGNWIPKE